MAGIPGETGSVTGEAITAHRNGDTGIVRGHQIAKLKIEGQLDEVRGTFVVVSPAAATDWLLVLGDQRERRLAVRQAQKIRAHCRARAQTLRGPGRSHSPLRRGRAWHTACSFNDA